MILRRVIDHLKHQNWTAVFLDFVIVVFGVFIGIQVANWNDALAQKRLGQYYTDRLVDDLQSDLVKSQIQTDYYAAVLAGIREAERLLSVSDSDARALLAAAYRASEISNNPTGQATWDQIVSSGHLGLLSKDILDSGLADYYRFAEANVVADNLLQTAPYRRTLRSIVPLSVQLAMREGCSDVTDDINIITGFVAECRLDIEDAEVEKVVETLRASPSLRTDLRYQYSLVYTVHNNEVGNQVFLKRLLAILEPEGRDR